MRKAIICDIDFCLLDSSEPAMLKQRADYHMNEQESWQVYYDNLHLCKRNEWCYELLEKMTHNNDIKVIFITGRSECARKATKQFFKFRHDIDWDLYMRPNNCFDADSEVKRSIMKNIYEDYDWLFALDDREDNCAMFNEFGITTLKVSSC